MDILVQPEHIFAILATATLLFMAGGALWIWRGIWLAQNKGQPKARTRWHWYVMTRRKMDRRRVAKAQAKGDAPPPVKLSIQSTAHNQRAKYDRRQRRGKMAR